MASAGAQRMFLLLPNRVMCVCTQQRQAQAAGQQQQREADNNGSALRQQ
jgi:hypothetical protein